MSTTGTAERQHWTAAHRIIAAFFLLGVGFVGVLAFTDIFLSVTHMLRAWWKGAAWTVIALGEGSFTTSYLGWMLLDLRAKLSQRARGWLFGYLSLFVVSSLVLMLYAGRDGAPDLLSHGLAVVAFYGLLILLKVAVRTLFADPAKRAMEEALADARRYAIDLCRARRGPLWRWRVPTLLKRQILTGRFPDAVCEAVEAVVTAGRSGGWQQDVREWVMGPDGLNLNAQAKVASDRAADAIARKDATPAVSADASRDATRPGRAGMPDATAPVEDATRPGPAGGISGMPDATGVDSCTAGDDGRGPAEDLRSLPPAEQARRAREMYENSGRTLSQRQLATPFGYSKQWGRNRILEVERGLHVVEQAG